MPAPAFDAAWLARSALLLVDMNRSHLDHSIGHLLVEKQEADRVIEAAVRARDLAAAAGLPIIFVRTHHRHDPRTDTIVDNKNPFWMAQQNAVIPGLGKPRRSTAIEGAPVTEVVPALAPRPGEHTVFKHRYSAFDNTDLEHLLRNLEIETLIICGVNTNNCVLCACFDAFNRDYRVVVLKDVCASMNGPDYHEAALKLIEAALGWVIHSDELADMLRRPTAA
jgi:nicotinamidase-related amidase